MINDDKHVFMFEICISYFVKCLFKYILIGKLVVYLIELETLSKYSRYQSFVTHTCIVSVFLCVLPFYFCNGNFYL